MAQVEVVILAAGKGTRMRSAQPKVLQPLAGKPLLHHVLHTAQQVADQGPIHLVVGHEAELLQASLASAPDLVWHYQQPQRGTGDALRCALPGLAKEGRVLVLYGDVPLLQAQTLQAFLQHVPDECVGLCSGELPDPAGYGRILRQEDGTVAGIQEERDCTPREREIREVNLGIMVLPANRLENWLESLAPNNAQGEYYLTDLVSLAAQDGIKTIAYRLVDPREALGVNDAEQLSQAERLFQARQIRILQQAGLRCADPARVDLRGSLEFGPDCYLEPNVILEGRIELGARVRIGAGAILRDACIGNDVEILPYSLLEGCKIDHDARIGPFARIRPGSEIGANAHVGNFVETKKLRLGAGSKVNHLSYLGDAEIGAQVNIGAGVITCNYDGVQKHKTEIEDGVFVGSDTQLVAPVRVGAGATIGAGSTITRDVPAGGLTLSRSPQKSIPHWHGPRQANKG